MITNIYTILKTKFENFEPKKLIYLVANLNKQAKLQYIEKRHVDGNSKPFCKACKPYFLNKKSNIQENIMLLEEDKFLPKQKDVA